MNTYELLELLRGIEPVPPGTREAALQQRIAEALEAEGLCYLREIPIGPQCRIDFWVPSGDGAFVEVKAGKPSGSLLQEQIARYAMRIPDPKLESLIVVGNEGLPPLPVGLHGVKIHTVRLCCQAGIGL